MVKGRQFKPKKYILPVDHEPPYIFLIEKETSKGLKY